LVCKFIYVYNCLFVKVLFVKVSTFLRKIKFYMRAYTHTHTHTHRKILRCTAHVTS